MKKNYFFTPVRFLIFGLCLFALNVQAQFVPQGLSYQCVVRDANQLPITNQNVTLTFQVRSGASNGPVVYGELHSVSTGNSGLVNLTIGKGTPVTGQFSLINWGGGAKFFQVLFDQGGNAVDLGTTEFQSVPYALHALSAANSTSGDNWGNQTVQTGSTIGGNGTPANPIQIAQQNANVGQVLKWSGTNWVPQDDISATGVNGGTVTQINTGQGLTGGPITTNGTIGLAPSGVTPNTYGSASEIPVLTIDATGRVTNIWTAVPSPGTVGIVGGSGIGVQQNGLSFTVTNTGDTNPNDDLTVNSNFNGDVTGVASNLQIKADAVTTNEILNQTILGIDINRMDALTGQVLKWNGNQWAPADDNGINTLNIQGGPGVTVTGTSPNLTIINSGDTNANDDLNTTDIADGDVTGIFTNLQLKAGVVNTVELANNAVTASKLDDMGAATGQVLKWNGTSWLPAADLTGQTSVVAGAGIAVNQILGGYSVVNTGDLNPTDDLTTSTNFDGDITGTWNQLEIGPGAVTGVEISQMGAATGEVLKWNGTRWAPAIDLSGSGGGGNSYQAGTGISITGTAPNLTIANTGDVSNTNEIQTLSISGTTLSLSNGGGSVTLPTSGSSNTYAAGTGISITGTAPNLVIQNTGDVNPTNELQNLQLTGTVLSLSQSTATVDLATLGAAQWAPVASHQRNTNAGNILIGKSTSSNGKLQVENNGSGQYTALFQSGANLADSATVYIRQLGTASALSTSGSIGVNVAKAAAPLHVRGVDETVLIEANNPTVSFRSNATGIGGGGVLNAYAQLNPRGMTVGSTADTVHVNLMPGGKAAVMANAKTGNVGIGNVNTTDYQLKVFADQAGLNIENTASGKDWEFWVNDQGQLVLYNDQLVPGTPAGVFDISGVYTASDARLKEGIQPLTAGALQKLLALQPVQYSYLNQREVLPGLIAQDVQKVLPELVKTVSPHHGKEAYLTVNYTALTPLLVKAMQEQQTQLELLKNQNAALEARLSKLEKK
jgi:hypothetical protein